MLGLPVAFAAPWVLVGLAALPVLWWLLRVTPPRPETVTFPPLRLLLRLRVEEETPARTPWWLTLLRLLLAALVILALAGPTLRPEAAVTAGSGPIWVLVDNGYSAGPDWQARLATAEAAVAEAAEAGRPVLVAGTADGVTDEIAASTPEEARRRLATIAPRSWSPDHAPLAGALADAATAAPPGDVVWIAEPADDGSGAAFAAALARMAPDARIAVAGAAAPPPVAVTSVAHDGEGLAANLRRIDEATAATGLVRALDRRGVLLDEQPFAFESGGTETAVSFALPLELRNEIARVEAVGVDSAAAVQLLDDRWRRRTVGLVSGVPSDRAQPLLSPTYYLTRALSPFADIREPRSPAVDAAVHGYLEDGIAAIAMADVGTLTGETAEAVADFVERGGVLIRFAGPRLAAGEDDVVPVELRRGGRTLGGSLTWEEPQALASFSETGPFADIPVPGDVEVERQVLAEPTADLGEHTWASLADGTPLVTAAQRGAGWIVLFHVTADTTWSNLPLSGSFVEMLRRAVALGTATGPATADRAVTTEALLAPMSILDGRGRLTSPPGDVRGIPASTAAAVEASRTTPAGLYGSEDAFRSVNLMRPDTPFVRLDLSGLDGRATAVPLRAETGIALEPWLFGAAFLLLLADAVIVILLVGGLAQLMPRRRAGAAAVLVAALAALAVPDGARAQGLSAEDQKLLDAVSQTRLAYVETGDAATDEASRLGLSALTRFLASRTALEAGEPMAVDPAVDELSVYPLIYWPIAPDTESPTPATMSRVDAFMKSGGTVLFDTRDQLSSIPGSTATTAESERLREMLATLDIPQLEPVPPDHVLTKSFYLLEDFPGRMVGSPLWVEASRSEEDPELAEAGEVRPVRTGDGVSPILITGNDFAGAWAADDAGSFLYPVVPGEPRQREFALRSGVNIVMYALTGNYKADQVHVPALLERLGQ